MLRPERKYHPCTIVVAAVLAWFGAGPAAALDDLSLTVGGGSSIVQPGDTVTVTLDVANLSTSINGVQALIRYDDTVLLLQDIVANDLGLTLPAEGWVEVFFQDDLGDVTYTAVINGDSTVADGTVATLTFTAIAEGSTNIIFRPDTPPLLTKLTVASDNTTILPSTTDSGTILSQCDDGLFCNGTDTFDGVACQPGTAPDCTVLTDQCNDGVCNETADACEAVPVNEAGTCDDADLCTENDTCQSGVCAGTAVDCTSLDDPCNVGTCNSGSGLCEAVPTNEGGSCDDGLFCNGTDSCSSGSCLSTGDPCSPLQCDEGSDSCFAPVHVDKLEVFYAGKYSDQPDSSKVFLATGATANASNITNYAFGITGIRVTFDNAVDFTTTAADAFFFDWTALGGTTFSPVMDVQTAVTVTSSVVGGVTVVDIVIVDDHVRRRWLKVTIDATQVTVTGVELDGELSGNPAVLPSGDGVPGGNPVFYIGNMAGEVTGDRKTTLTDVGQVRLQVNPALLVPIDNAYDIDKSGKVQLGDAGRARLDVNPALTLPLISP